MDLKSYLSKQEKIVNNALKKSLPKDNSIISQAMRYSLLAGGKRLRPIFVMLAAELFGVKAEKVMPAACAVEYIHTYSLVHDDLPAMDNDDLRRGKPTSHKKFGEAAAILCGDALLTEAFNLITKSSAEGKNISKAVSILSTYAGFKGMIAGQAEDTIFAGKWNKKDKAFLSKKLRFIQITKTAALLTASLKMGAVLAGADDKSVKALEIYGTNAGIAFQIADDILDVYADKKLLGKKGSDKDNDKLTELSLFGKEQAEKNAALYVKKAKNALKIFGSKAEKLIALADYMTERKY
ncbi:MAG: polyprenyl synthetase family protein [Endomicrobia bacterium]|nr:polyprenyl synthetase family protein [Endomicrobiia bacterium]MCL2506996.1 polyprenyl synthetase family protein [Endomicrobiia bacterium]